MKRLGLFVDLSNLYMTVLRLFETKENPNPKIDFRKYYHYFDEYGKVSFAMAFGAFVEGEEDSLIHFNYHLRKTGFIYSYKKIKEYTNENRFKRKADQDVDITISAIRNIDKYDVFILGSGDGDFLPLIEYLKEKEKTIFIFASKISRELKEKSDEFFTITPDILFVGDTITPKFIAE